MNPSERRQRPTVGKLTVPYMVDERRSPIDFKAVDAAHVERLEARRIRRLWYVYCLSCWEERP